MRASGRLLAWPLLRWALLFFPAVVLAHPHSWITLKAEFLLDEESRLTGLIQHWEFDVFYSMMALADALNENGDERKALRTLGEGMVRNLKKHNYFSELAIQGRRIKLSPPTQWSLDTVLVDGERRLDMKMHFTFSSPSAVENQTLSLRVFDPTYYIDMRHYTATQIIVHAKNATECATTVELPDTPDEIIEYAASLDKNQKNTTGLGDQFAERVLLRCR